MPASVFRWIARAMWRIVRGVLLALAVVVLYVEEWGWRPLAAGLARLGRWLPLRRLEDRVRRVSPRWALALFLVPAALLFPIKLLALGLIQQGRAALGVALIVAAKLLGTALVGRLFMLTETQLMSFGWFARVLGWWTDTKRRVRAAVQASALARALRALRCGTRRRWRLWLRRLARRFAR